MVGFIRDHSVGPRGRLFHSRVGGFIWVGLGVLGFIRVTLVRLRVVGFILVRVDSVWRARGRRGYSGSRGFTWAHLVVFVFIRVRVGSLQRA